MPHIARYVPFGHVLLVERHKYGIFGGVANRVEFPQQEFNEFLSVFFRDDWESVDDDKCVQTLLEFHFILRLKI